MSYTQEQINKALQMGARNRQVQEQREAMTTEEKIALIKKTYSLTHGGSKQNKKKKKRRK